MIIWKLRCPVLTARACPGQQCDVRTTPLRSLGFAFSYQLLLPKASMPPPIESLFKEIERTLSFLNMNLNHFQSLPFLATKDPMLYDYVYMKCPESANLYRQKVGWWLPRAGRVGGKLEGAANGFGFLFG